MDVGWITRQAIGSSGADAAERPALTFEGGETWTYRQLHGRVNQYAHSLQDMGIKPGDRIGILMQNAIEYVALYLAVARLGAIAVRINFRLLAEELSYILHDAKPRVLCLDDATAAPIGTLIEQLPVQRFIVRTANPDHVPSWAESWDVLTQKPADELNTPLPHASDPVMLMYTSGTTGRPKGALWCHDNLLWFAAMQVMRWGLSAKTVSLMTGPMYHVGAMEDIGLATLMTGGHVVIMRSGQFDIRRVLASIAQHRITDAILFPFMIYDLLQLPEISSDEMGTLRHIYSGGDPLLPWATEELSTRFPAIALTQVYGLTEGTPVITSLDGDDALAHAGSVGTPLPMAEISVMGEDDGKRGVDEIGEIWTRSPVVVSQYWNNAEATRVTFHDGWCRTGDLGKIDAAGYLYVVGRKKDMIRSGGENIYPAEIEDVLMRHPAVKEAAVIGVPDPDYIEAVCAVVVRRPSMALSAEDVISYCRQHLAGYKKPRRVEFVEELPRTPSGKVTKHLLRERWAQP